MFVLKFLRFVFGYVSFTAKGGFSERFINLCRINNILLWELKSANSVLTACTDCSGYKKIRTVARKSGMKVRLKKKHGLPFFLNRHSRRAGVIVGVAFGIAVTLILSTRIWSVDVTGNVRVPAERITAVFEELGVKKGVPSAKIDIKSTEIEALRRMPEISWLNINISGCAARIEVRETVEVPEIDDNGTPTDIVASRDGQIVILRPFSGTKEQKIGNAVLKGDPLISGIVENKDLTVSFCRAKGYVVARTEHDIKTQTRKKIKVRKKTGEKKSCILNFLFFDIPLGKVNQKNAYLEKREVFINGVTLPVGFTVCRETVYEESEITLTENQVKLSAYSEFLEECAEKFRYMKVEKGEITEKNADGNLTVSGKFVCLENIGKEIPMDIEETNQ